MEIPIKMDDLGVPLFSETPISKFVGMNVKKLSISSKRVVGSKSALSYPPQSLTDIAPWKVTFQPKQEAGSSSFPTIFSGLNSLSNFRGFPAAEHQGGGLPGIGYYLTEVECGREDRVDMKHGWMVRATNIPAFGM